MYTLKKANIAELMTDSSPFEGANTLTAVPAGNRIRDNVPTPKDATAPIIIPKSQIPKKIKKNRLNVFN